MIRHYCILNSTPELFGAWVQRTAPCGTFDFDDSPAMRLVVFPAEVTARDATGLTITMQAVRQNRETGESRPFPVEAAIIGVYALTATCVEVWMALGDYTSRIVDLWRAWVNVIGEIWPEAKADLELVDGGEKQGRTPNWLTLEKEDRLRAMWHDETMTHADIAKALGGYDADHIRKIGYALGLPRRKPGRKSGK